MLQNYTRSKIIKVSIIIIFNKHKLSFYSCLFSQTLNRKENPTKIVQVLRFNIHYNNKYIFFMYLNSQKVQMAQYYQIQNLEDLKQIYADVQVVHVASEDVGVGGHNRPQVNILLLKKIFI